ncbi:serine protease [Streptococcus hillyeri]|uniref:Serine protease n=2 Tax=Streptococcus hillyeri TaxID=2282420 RepID=A0A3L9DTW4_9STRE|nr:serine protease [Streptococcus hillyeri]
MVFSPVAFAATKPLANTTLGNQYPYQLSYFLELDVDGNRRSSAMYIGNGYLLTAAHAITDDSGQVPSYRVFGYANGKNLDTRTDHSDIDSGAADKVFQPMPGYLGKGDMAYDIGLVRLTRPSQRTTALNTSQVRFGVYSQLSKLKGKQFTIISNSLNVGGRWAYETGTIAEVRNDGLLRANITAVQGQSGSPIIVDGEIVGVATGTLPNGQLIITPLTTEIADNLLRPNGFTSISIK